MSIWYIEIFSWQRELIDQIIRKILSRNDEEEKLQCFFISRKSLYWVKLDREKRCDKKFYKLTNTIKLIKAIFYLKISTTKKFQVRILSQSHIK